jgi:uncharacterized flavoprotein (TIGR03862 family)
MSSQAKTAVVVGGGPAGLIAAETLLQSGVHTELYDAMPSVGRKFLRAGKGGLNLTHSEPFDDFLARYGARTGRLRPYLEVFGPTELRQWIGALGFETFVGSSGRVFPKGMNSSPILRAWRQRLAANGLVFHLRHRWIGWDEDGNLHFDTPKGETFVQAEAAVLALGGGSWPQLGSDGSWMQLLEAKGIRVASLKPANCGFNVAWSEHFRDRFHGQPVKPVTLSFINLAGQSIHQQGELLITKNGIEGGLVYAVSAPLRDFIEVHGHAEIHVDLAPDWTQDRLVERLSTPRGSRSISSHLKRSVGIDGVKAGLLWEFVPREKLADAEQLAGYIKRLPVPIISPRPLAEAISSAGGVTFEELDENLMLKNLPGVFCAGEMLDWEAPTGGYLLTACFATGRAAGLGVVKWLQAGSDRS